MLCKNTLVMLMFVGLGIISLGGCAKSSSNQVVNNSAVNQVVNKSPVNQVVDKSPSNQVVNKSPVDQIIDRKTFLQVLARCKATAGDNASRCVLKTFTLKTETYCADNELSSGNPKCVEIQKKVTDKVGDNFMEDLTDALKK
jgi:hypothetical protein